MSRADLEPVSTAIEHPCLAFSSSRRPVYRLRRRSDSKSLYRESLHGASRESVQPNIGRIQQENAKVYAHLIRDARRVTPRSAARKRLERFQGFVERVEGNIAYISLTNEKGEHLRGPYPANELACAGIHERDRFVLSTIELGQVVRIEVTPLPRVNLTPEQQREIEEETRRMLAGFHPVDDY